MKGKQVVMSLYLPPNKYWLLKWLNRRTWVSVHALLRQAVDEVPKEAARSDLAPGSRICPPEKRQA